MNKQKTVTLISGSRRQRTPSVWLIRVAIPRGSKLAQSGEEPTSPQFMSSYRDVDYRHSQSAVWATIGGTLGTYYGSIDANSCAARLSYALNHSGHPIQSHPEFQTNLNSDGQRYIISATQMKNYLNSEWGTPDRQWDSSSTSLATIRSQIPAGGAAIACWPGNPGHCTVVTATYNDQYAPYGGGSGPADVWFLENFNQ